MSTGIQRTIYPDGWDVFSEDFEDQASGVETELLLRTRGFMSQAGVPVDIQGQYGTAGLDNMLFPSSGDTGSTVVISGGYGFTSGGYMVQIVSTGYTYTVTASDAGKYIRLTHLMDDGSPRSHWRDGALANTRRTYNPFGSYIIDMVSTTTVDEFQIILGKLSSEGPPPTFDNTATTGGRQILQTTASPTASGVSVDSIGTAGTYPPADVQEHIDTVGSGTPDSTNPHGLRTDDLDEVTDSILEDTILMDASTGHDHDGTAAGGTKVTAANVLIASSPGATQANVEAHIGNVGTGTSDDNNPHGLSTTDLDQDSQSINEATVLFDAAGHDHSGGANGQVISAGDVSATGIAADVQEHISQSGGGTQDSSNPHGLEFSDLDGSLYVPFTQAIFPNNWNVHALTGTNRSIPVPPALDYEVATAGSGTSITAASTGWITDQWIGHYVYVLTGTGVGQIRSITTNSATILTVSSAWTVNPVFGDTFIIINPGDPNMAANYRMPFLMKEDSLDTVQWAPSDAVGTQLPAVAFVQAPFGITQVSANPQIRLIGKKLSSNEASYIFTCQIDVIEPGGSGTPSWVVPGGASSDEWTLTNDTNVQQNTFDLTNVTFTDSSILAIRLGPDAATQYTDAFSIIGAQVRWNVPPFIVSA